MLIEINMGRPDFRVRRLLPFSVPSVTVFSNIIQKIPVGVDIGWGGEPLRLKGSLDYLEILVRRFNTVSVASSRLYLDTKKLSYLEQNAIFLALEIKDESDLEFALEVSLSFPDLHFVCSTTGSNLRNIDWQRKANRLGIDLTYENFIPFNRRELDTLVDIIRQHGLYIKCYRCGIFDQSILGLNADGTVLPCVTMQFPEMVMGNLLIESFKKIMERVDDFRRKLTCSMCCQSRSYALNMVLDQDPLCAFKS